MVRNNQDAPNKPLPPLPWPKLSETLTSKRAPDHCQSCGHQGTAVREEEPGKPTPPVLVRWAECDELDRATNVVVVLCKACSDQLIERHPRLYRALQPHEPHPGSMPLCTDCRHRIGMNCTHPRAKRNGGEGVELVMPKPVTVFVDFRGKDRHKSGPQTVYRGPVHSCGQREEVSAAADKPG